MRSRPHVVADVVCKHSAQPSRVQHDHMIEALAPDRANDTLHVRVLPRRSRRRSYLLDVHPFEGGRDVREDRIAIVQEILGSLVLRKGISQLLCRAAVGCAVTATWTIRRRSCASMTNANNSRHVIVGTTNRSAAMIWLA